MEYGGLGYIEALKELAEGVGLKLPEFSGGERKARPAEEGPDLYELLAQAARHFRDEPEGLAARDRLPQGPRAHRQDRRALRHRLRAGRLAEPRRGLSALRGQGARRMRPRDRERGQALRPLPRSRDVPDPQPARHRDRLRRARARGGRRPEVPQLARDAGVREGPRALRPAAGARRHPRLGPGGRGRGLHGRRDARRARRRERGRDARHGDDAGARAEAPAPGRGSRVLLRRRRRRPARGVACARSEPARRSPTARPSASSSCRPSTTPTASSARTAAKRSSAR